ncbi:hypothetical protein RJ640_001256 [Escallonia rubra]|uniref:Uncharacterized protein n=1 Tax=Escallonia rubra TaxID=112253 RepID=A0AA88UQJ2_9ASTE|nr:hypothetical protein RJ640_001256 [Escallonia rubra]
MDWSLVHALIKGRWTDDEDKKLIGMVKKHGVRKWAQIAEKVIGRAGEQCRKRSATIGLLANFIGQDTRRRSLGRKVQMTALATKYRLCWSWKSLNAIKLNWYETVIFSYHFEHPYKDVRLSRVGSFTSESIAQLASGLAQRLDPFSPEADGVSPQGVTSGSNPSFVIGDPMKKKTISDIQIDYLTKQLGEAGFHMDEKSQDNSSCHINECTTPGKSNLLMTKSEAILVIKQLQEKIRILETEKSSSLKNLNYVVELVTEQNIYAREQYEKVAQTRTLCSTPTSTGTSQRGVGHVSEGAGEVSGRRSRHVYGSGGGGGFVGEVYKDSWGDGYNVNGVKKRRFLVQWVWNPVKRRCFGPNAMD